MRPTLRRALARVTFAVALVATACGTSVGLGGDGSDQAGAPAPLVAGDTPAADGESVVAPEELPLLGDEIGASAVTPAAPDAAVWPGPGTTAPALAVPGLPQSIDIEETNVATAHATQGTVAIWSEPSRAAAPTWTLAVPTEFGGLRHFAVLDEAVGDDGARWLRVQVPVRPNGSEGWIPADSVDVAPVTTRILVDLSERSVIVWDGDEVVMNTTGAIGADATPTPTGSYYIRDMFPWDPESIYGPWVFALSSYSEVIDQINGGDAVVAIHGTRNNTILGQAVSLGCIRLDNDTLRDLARFVEPGTPVEVVP